MGILSTDNWQLNTREEDGKIYVTGVLKDGGSVLNIPGNFDDKPIAGIDKKAFFASNMLKEVNLHKTVKEIGDWAFSRCPLLKTFSIDTDDETLSVEMGRGIFEGSARLESIKLIGGSDKDFMPLAAACAVRLPAAYLLRDKDFGSKTWYARFDMALLSFLAQDDHEGSSNSILCGEEDISYDGIGSVDGELLGETAAFVREVGKNKCYLALIRLLNPGELSDNTRNKLVDYLRERQIGTASGSAWNCIKEDFDDNCDIFTFYLDITKPGPEELDLMLSDLKGEHAQSRVVIINYKSNITEKAALFDGLFL